MPYAGLDVNHEPRGLGFDTNKGDLRCQLLVHCGGTVWRAGDIPEIRPKWKGPTLHFVFQPPFSAVAGRLIRYEKRVHYYCIGPCISFEDAGSLDFTFGFVSADLPLLNDQARK